VTGELKQKQAPATATRCCCGGRTDTELQVCLLSYESLWFNQLCHLDQLYLTRST
jgi:hypothetical protein